jgi:hypothetical protein
MVITVEQLVEWMIGKGNRSTRTKNVPVSLSATQPTWLDPGSNLGRDGGKPATNRLSYGTTILHCSSTTWHEIALTTKPLQRNNKVHTASGRQHTLVQDICNENPSTISHSQEVRNRNMAYLLTNISHNTLSSSELTPSLREMTTAPQRWPVKLRQYSGGNSNACSTQKKLNTRRKDY